MGLITHTYTHRRTHTNTGFKLMFAPTAADLSTFFNSDLELLKKTLSGTLRGTPSSRQIKWA